MSDLLERGAAMDLVRMEMDKALKKGKRFSVGASGRVCDLYLRESSKLGAIERIALLGRLVSLEAKDAQVS